MKLKKIAMYMLAGLALPMVANAAVKVRPNTVQPQPSTEQTLLQKMDLLIPGSDAPAYKVKANQKTGTQWHVDMAYGYYHVHHTGYEDKKNTNVHAVMLHGHVNQRLIQDDVNGGTWLHVEFIGSWGLGRDSVQAMQSDLGSLTSPHRDLVGPYDFYFPEVSLKHFMFNKKAAIIGGMIKMNNYFDSVSIANDTYTSFMNSGFCNSEVLPLTDSNLGAIVQVQLGKKDYVMAGVTRTGNDAGDDPFKTEKEGVPDKTGYVVMGEWGHYFKGGKGITKVTPFFRMLEHLDENHRDAGIVGSVEYTVSDNLTVFTRGGLAAKQDYDNAAELTVGLRAKVVPTRKDDYLGLAAGVFKGQAPYDRDGETGHNRETVLEAYYNIQLNKYFSIMPRLQYIHGPAYSDHSDTVIAGIQGVLCF